MKKKKKNLIILKAVINMKNSINIQDTKQIALHISSYNKTSMEIQLLVCKILDGDNSYIDELKELGTIELELQENLFNKKEVCLIK